MAISTKPASGFRDFLPTEMRRRKRVFDVIERVYNAFGFERIDTPCVERLDTLLGKYGEEGDQLIFKILQRGDKLERALQGEQVRDIDLADAGLRYDLTVPLARVYAQYRNDLPRYFKRYQIAPVWRADRPQRGRFREFYQCDVDVVGSSSMAVEAEVTAALATILKELGFLDVRIHVNHRRVLQALMQVSQISDAKEADALIAIDKLDKIGRDGVVNELKSRGIADDSVATLMGILDGFVAPGTDGFSNEAVLAHLEGALASSDQGLSAIADLRSLLSFASGGPAASLLCLDPYLARGLSYYTGPIFEVRSDAFPGSLGGGGRYDGLIGMFMKEDVPACGFSLGVERLLVLMEESGMFTDEVSDVDVLVTLWGAETTAASLALAHELRAKGVRVDVYPDHDKYGKQFKYADSRRIPYVVLMGPDEVSAQTVTLKHLGTGQQQSFPRSDAAAAIVAAISKG
ncbi:MAG: histidine--tRNA ligase [bacterium]